MTNEVMGVVRSRVRRLASAVIRQAVDDHLQSMKRISALHLTGAELAMAVSDGVDRLEALRAAMVVLLNERERAENAFGLATHRLHRARVELGEYEGGNDARRSDLKRAAAVCLADKCHAEDERHRVAAEVSMIRGDLLRLESLFDSAAWIMSDSEDEWSYLWCCEIANLPPAGLRSQMFDPDIVERAKEAVKLEQKDLQKKLDGEVLAYSIY
jgi:hypothetical protein